MSLDGLLCLDVFRKLVSEALSELVKPVVTDRFRVQFLALDLSSCSYD